MIPPRLTADGLAGLLRLAAQTGVKAGSQSAGFGKLLQEIGKTAAPQTAQDTPDVQKAVTDLTNSAKAATGAQAAPQNPAQSQAQPAPNIPQSANATAPQNTGQNNAAPAGQNAAPATAARAMADTVQPALIQAAMLANRASTGAEKRQERSPLAGQLGFVSHEKPFLGELGLPLNTVKQAYGRDAEFIRPLTGDPLSNEREPTPKTPLWIGAIPSFAGWLLPEILRGLHDITPRLLRGDQDRILQSLAEGRIELALLHNANIPETLAQVPLVQFMPWVLLHRAHPLAAQERLAPQDLAGEPMIGLSLPPARDLFPNILRAEGVEPDLVDEFPDELQVLNAVARGQGFSLRAASQLAPPDIAQREVICRPLDLRTGAVDQAVLVYPAHCGHSVAAEHFIQRAKSLADA